MRATRTFVGGAATGRNCARLAVLPLLVAGFVFTSTPSLLAQASGSDPKLQAELTKSLNKKELSNVHASLQGDTVTLTGTVEVFDQKLEADRRVHHIKGVTAVANEIQVNAEPVPDDVLRDKLSKAIEYDRVGYGTTAFNAISVQVQNGVVALGGTAYGPVDADSAVSVAANTKGVRDVINNIQVDPLSPMDDRIRLQAYRTIYGFPSLNKYAVDPGKPIRISVAHGVLTLYGVVESQSDKETAGIRANTVPGAFKVINNLQVANQQQERN
jgi:osmotically-inducible protein OsmY